MTFDTMRDIVATTSVGPAFSIQAERAAQVMMRRSPETQRTYQGIYARFAACWLDTAAFPRPWSAFTPEAFVALP